MLWLSTLLAAPVEPNAHVGWLVKFLGGMDPNAAALGITVVGGAIGTVAITVYVKWVKAKHELAMLAVPPTAPVQPAALPAPPVIDVTGRIAALEMEVKLGRQGWDLDTCRSRVRDLEATVRDLGADGARTAQALSGERIARERAESALATAIRERDAAERRAQLMADELADLKHDLNSGHTQIGNVTPLRPPKSTR